jgi:adiponectin receptor
MGADGFTFFEDGHISTVAACYHKLYIEYGYRKPNSFKHALLTLFSFHNETMNIWSHLIGAICVLVVGVQCSFEFFASSMPPLELIALEVYISCATICLLLSAVFHWLCCCSEEANSTLLKMDFAGIALLITGSYVPGIYYGFHCTPDIQRIHFALTGVIFGVGMTTPFMSDKVRPYALASLAATGAIPFAHWCLTTPPEFSDELLHGFLWMFFWYTTGFVLYASAFPERRWPKR